MKNLLALLLIVATLSRCGTTSKAVEPFKDTEFYDSTFDKIWSAAISAIGEDNLPIKIIEKASGILQTNQILIDKEQMKLYSNIPDDAITASGKMSLQILVREEEGKVKVKITQYIEGEYMSAFSGSPYTQWSSTGAIEKKYHEKIRRLLSK